MQLSRRSSRRLRCSSTSTEILLRKYLRHHRNQHAVDGAELMALEPAEIAAAHAGDENNRRVLETRMAVDHAGGFDTVHAGHAHVEQYHCAFSLHQPLQGLFARACTDQILSQLLEYRFVGKQSCRLIVDQQDVDRLIVARGSGRAASAHRCSHFFTSDNSWSPLSGLAR